MSRIAFDDRCVRIDGLIRALIFLRLVVSTLTRLLIAEDETEKNEDQDEAHHTENDPEIPSVDILLIDGPWQG